MPSPLWSSGKFWPAWRSLNTCEGEAEPIHHISLTRCIEIKPLHWLLGTAEAPLEQSVGSMYSDLASELAPYQTRLHTWFMGNLQIIHEVTVQLPQRSPLSKGVQGSFQKNGINFSKSGMVLTEFLATAH